MLNIGWDLVFTIINLIVLYLAMKKFLIGPVTGIMEKRKAMIEGGLENVRAKEAEADSLKAQYEEALGAAKEESRQILEASRKTANEERARIIEDANAKARDAIEKNQKALEAQKERMLKEVQSQVADLAVTAAKKVLGQASGAGEDLKLYDEFINKAGESNDTKSL